MRSRRPPPAGPTRREAALRVARANQTSGTLLDQLAIERFVPGDRVSPTQIRLGPPPCAASLLPASALVAEQLGDPIAELGFVGGDPKLFAVGHLEPLRRERRRDDRLPGVE